MTITIPFTFFRLFAIPIFVTLSSLLVIIILWLFVLRHWFIIDKVTLKFILTRASFFDYIFKLITTFLFFTSFFATWVIIAIRITLTTISTTSTRHPPFFQFLLTIAGSLRIHSLLTLIMLWLYLTINWNLTGEWMHILILKFALFIDLTAIIHIVIYLFICNLIPLIIIFVFVFCFARQLRILSLTIWTRFVIIILITSRILLSWTTVSCILFLLYVSICHVRIEIWATFFSNSWTHTTILMRRRWLSLNWTWLICSAILFIRQLVRANWRPHFFESFPFVLKWLIIEQAFEVLVIANTSYSPLCLQ